MAKRSQQRRDRKQSQRQLRLDRQAISQAPIPAQEASYRRATELDLQRGEKCTACRFNLGENFCELFFFYFVTGFVCDRFEPRSKELTYDDLRLAQGLDTKSLNSFRASITAASKGLYSGSFGLIDFINSMNSAIEKGYEQAWRDGAKTCGIKPKERTKDEQAQLNGLIGTAKESVFDLGEWIEGKTDEPFKVIKTRLELWTNRYNEVSGKAITMSCANQKYEWLLGDADHCKTCKKLNGRVMRASRWNDLDVYPQDTRPGKLECQGFNCDCSLNKTDKNATPGPLPGLP